MNYWAIGVPALAVILDTFIGDPNSGWHPVVLIGKLIARLERFLLKDEDSPADKQAAGLALAMLTIAITYGLVWLVLYVIARVNPFLAEAAGAVLLVFAISPRSLAEAGRKVRDALASGDMMLARTNVSMIVGRDTAELGVPDITRATVETVAENIVDGIIAPLFYAFIGGVPLAFFYRAVNTLDSMVGYKNTKYADFGMASARIDDIFNYVPARITAPFIVLAAALLGYDYRGSIRAIGRDAAKHPSPNSGIPEAGVAGALGVRLGGVNYYGGVESFRAYMGEPLQELGPRHIDGAIRLLYLTTGLFVAAGCAVSVLVRS